MLQITAYCSAIVIVALAGGLLPLRRRIGHVTLQVYLSLSAGAMLGAAFFHMLPESSHLCPEHFGFWMAVGVLGLYVIERFLSPHSHDADGAEPETGHGEIAAPACAGTHAHAHTHDAAPQASRSAAPKIAGWSAVLGLFLHTLMGGAALGSAVIGHDATPGLGLAVFLATVLHKPADAFTISTLLTKAGFSRARTLGIQVAFALTLPLGVVLYAAGESAVSSVMLGSTLTGAVLAFSAGTFVCIALSDLLPEVQFHSHDRGRLFAAVIFGAAVMWATALFEPPHMHGPPPAAAAEEDDHGHDHPHDHDH